MRTAHKCRAYPDPEQASVLNRTFGCVRVVWNQTLAWRHQRYHAEKAGTNLTQANAYLTAMKTTEDLAFSGQVSSVRFNRTSVNLVRDHDVIVLEDLAVKNMVRNRSLAKAISDCGWGTFRAMIEYKAQRYGRHVIMVDRWYPEFEDVLVVRVSPRHAELGYAAVVVPVLRHPARPGHQRCEEHPGGRSCRDRGQPRPCLRS